MPSSAIMRSCARLRPQLKKDECRPNNSDDIRIDDVILAADEGAACLRKVLHKQDGYLALFLRISSCQSSRADNITLKCGLEIHAVSGPDSSKRKINRNIWA
jgi:hypothetical protein